jgi:hypothetical protein
VVKYHPQPNKFAAFNSFNRYVVGAGKLEVSKCPSLFILAVFILNSTTHLLPSPPLSIADITGPKPLPAHWLEM